MWHNGTTGEIAVQCPHCGSRDWRSRAELKLRRLVCFACARQSAWPPGVDSSRPRAHS